MFPIGIELGVIAPSNAGEIEAKEEITRQSSSREFIDDLTPIYYNFIYFDKKGNIVKSSLEGNALSQEIERYRDENVTYTTGVYVFYEDGSCCLFTWRYGARFVNQALRNIMPNLEFLIMLITGILLLLFFFIFCPYNGSKAC